MNVNLRIHDDPDRLVVERWQDVEPHLEQFKAQAKEEINRKSDLRKKWSLPPIEVIKFYDRYAAGNTLAKPMNQEFWEWVDREIMTNADYAVFRTSNPSNPFFLGWNDP